MNRLARSLVAGLLAVVCVLARPAIGRADLEVTVDTSALPTGYTYAIDYQFALGGPSTSNTATVYGFGFGIGGSAGDPSTVQTTGAVTGTLQSAPVTLSGATGGFAEFTQNFTPGTKLTFDLGVTNSPLSAGQQDTFTFGLLYYDPSAGGFVNIATGNPNGNNSFLEIDTSSASGGSLTVIASTSQGYDPTFSVPAPTVQVIGVPEPSGVLAALAGLPCMGMLLGLARRRRAAPVAQIATGSKRTW